MSTFFIIVCLAVIGVTYSQQYSNGSCCEEYCFTRDTDKRQIKQFSTKTAYDFVRGTEALNYFNVPNCDPVKFWMLSRHGARLPSATQIRNFQKLPALRDEIIKNYQVRRTKPDRGALCSNDISLLQDWNWDYNITTQFEEYLTTQGWNNMKVMGINYQHALPGILENIYTPEKFSFRHTGVQRTEASFKAFVQGLFGEDASEHVQAGPVNKPDNLLKPYENCPAWDKKDSDKSNPNSEVHKFMETDMYKNLLTDVSTRLGFKFALTSTQIDDIWDACRYEQSWYISKLSPWCAAFTPSQITILEYLEDLKYYYLAGPGKSINGNLPCSIVQDLINKFDSKANPKAAAYFAHDYIVQMFLVAIGAKKDSVPLRADNFQTMSKYREWKTSEIVPFAANLIAIKYDCPNDKEREKMTLFLNEKPISLDWCNVGLCDWSKFKQQFERYANGNCDAIYCTENSANSISIKFGVLITAIICAALALY